MQHLFKVCFGYEKAQKTKSTCLYTLNTEIQREIDRVPIVAELILKAIRKIVITMHVCLGHNFVITLLYISRQPKCFSTKPMKSSLQIVLIKCIYNYRPLTFYRKD